MRRLFKADINSPLTFCLGQSRRNVASKTRDANIIQEGFVMTLSTNRNISGYHYHISTTCEEVWIGFKASLWEEGMKLKLTKSTKSSSLARASMDSPKASHLGQISSSLSEVNHSQNISIKQSTFEFI